jgi:hypothetical protein
MLISHKVHRIEFWCLTPLSAVFQLFHGDLFKLQKRCTRIAVACDKDYQLLAHGRWFSPGTPASSTTKTGRHEIAEILLKVVQCHNNKNSY